MAMTAETREQKPSMATCKEALADYRRIYLPVPAIEDRKPVFLSKETRDRLDRIVRLFGERKMSVSGLTENIVRRHLEIGPVRDAEDKQTVAATLPKQVQAPLPTDWSQDLLQGIGRAGVHQPKYGGSAARRYQGAPHERATRHGSPKEQIRQKTGPQEVFT